MPPIQWVPRALSLGVKRPGHEAKCRGQRMRGAMPPLPQYAFVAWYSVKAQGQLYLYLYVCNHNFLVICHLIMYTSFQLVTNLRIMFHRIYTIYKSP
jgi:hypothetical protein